MTLKCAAFRKILYFIFQQKSIYALADTSNASGNAKQPIINHRRIWLELAAAFSVVVCGTPVLVGAAVEGVAVDAVTGGRTVEVVGDAVDGSVLLVVAATVVGVAADD